MPNHALTRLCEHWLEADAHGRKVLTGPSCWCAGRLPFAQRGDDRNNNLMRLQQMFPRIVNAQYDEPKYVSAQGRHLLSRMMTSDPAHRITMTEARLPSPSWICRRTIPLPEVVPAHLGTWHAHARLA